MIDRVEEIGNKKRPFASTCQIPKVLESFVYTASVFLLKIVGECGRVGYK